MKESEKKTGLGVARDEAAVPLAGGEIHVSPSGGASAEEKIRMRAYALYRERGGKVGDDTADWLRAEQEYLAGAPRTTADPLGQGTSASAPSPTSG
jgi:hypothetical protein